MFSRQRECVKTELGLLTAGGRQERRRQKEEWVERERGGCRGRAQRGEEQDSLPRQRISCSCRAQIRRRDRCERVLGNLLNHRLFCAEDTPPQISFHLLPSGRDFSAAVCSKGAVGPDTLSLLTPSWWGNESLPGSSAALFNRAAISHMRSITFKLIIIK